MRILFIAPHPFYQDRGTPIDVLLVLRVLSERPSTKIDLLTYHEGTDVELPNVRIDRIRAPRFLDGIRPGFSIKKLACDFLLLVKAWIMVHRNRYDFIHADEESVFFALMFRAIYRIPYAYDLDSSLAQQLVESRSRLSWAAALFNRLEALAIRKALINLPVCLELARVCQRAGSRFTVVLHDISQLAYRASRSGGQLKRELGVVGTLVVYAGNFELYQGIDLLIESFGLAIKNYSDLYLAMIGGTDEDIDRYSKKALALGLAGHVFFLGRRPITELADNLADADIVVSPRVSGINTPMKVFAYLDSGRALIATDILTHNQILTPEIAMLVPPTPRGLAEGIVKLARDPVLRGQLAENGRSFIRTNHTFEAHRERVNLAYDWIDEQLSQHAGEEKNVARFRMDAE